MNLDQNAAAFGLFHLMFANLTQQLAAALFYIRQLREPDLKFEDVFKLEFSRLLKEFKKELKRFDESDEMDLQLLHRTCERIKDLGNWRNARVHPRVKIDDHGITIYDWRTRKQLIIDYNETVQKIERATWLTVELETYAGSLLRRLESERKWDECFDEIWGKGENEESSA